MIYNFIVGYEISNTDTYQKLPTGPSDPDGICKDKDCVRARFNTKIDLIRDQIGAPFESTEPVSYDQLLDNLKGRLGNGYGVGTTAKTIYYYVDGRLVCVTTHRLLAGGTPLLADPVESSVGTINAEYTVGWSDKH